MLRWPGECGRVRRPMRHAVFLVTASLLLVTTGCKSYCRQLSEKVCDCTTSTTEKTSCLTVVSNKETRYSPTEETEARCQALLTECDCRLIDTPAGKEKCGYAEPSDGGL